jgi:hypothetical protein
MRAAKIFWGAFVATISGLIPALADNVATAVSVETHAAAEQPGATRVLATGVGLVQDETVRTDQSGRAQLKFVDDTSLVIGPKSAVKLDKFVFDPNRTARKFVIEATVGAFRFATGKSSHGVYEIRTPTAVIGVRGTRFAFGIEGDEVTIVVTQGAVRSCLRASAGATARCATTAAGNTIVSTPAGVVVRRTLGAVPNVLRTVLTLPNPANPVPGQVPGLRDAMQGIRPLDTPAQGLNRALPAAANPALVAPLPNPPNQAPGLGGGLPSPSLPDLGGIGGGAAPRLPPLAR